MSENQPLLFDAGDRTLRTLARRTDPETSRAAADKHAASGSRASHKRLLLEALHRSPGLTSAEYAKHTGLDRHEAARRLADLRNDGDARQGERRQCGVCRKTCVTWEPTR